MKTPKERTLIEQSEAITRAWVPTDEPDGVDFHWWDDSTLLTYSDSPASKLLNEDDADSLAYELEKRGLK